jgi:hypothetical protein
MPAALLFTLKWSQTLVFNETSYGPVQAEAIMV